MKRYIYVILIALLAFSCRGAKYYVNEAKKYEKSRDYEQAVAYYAEAYSMDPNNRDARKGFKKTGQRLLDELYEDMETSYKNRNYKETVEKYQKIDKYYKNVKNRGIDLEIPQGADSLYWDAQDKYFMDLYQEAYNSINAGNYGAARTKINEIKKTDPNYKGIDKLELALEVDPTYMQGVNTYNTGKKFLSVEYFNEVNTRYPDYRETQNYLDELSKLPKQIIALFPVDNKSAEATITRLVYRGVESKLMGIQGPMLSVQDEMMVQNELLKANKNANPPFDDNSILQIGTTLASTRAVSITITDFMEEPLNKNETFQIAYVRERVTYWDPYYGQTSNYQWRETKYKEVEEGAKYTLLIKIRIFDPVTGNLIYNDMVTKSVTNKLKYARYDSDYNDLFPTMGYISQTDLNKWRSRFTADKDKKSKSELIDMLVKAANDELFDIIVAKLSN